MWMLFGISILVIPLGIPGTFIIAGLTLLEGLLTQFIHVTPGTVIVLFVIAVGLEGVEYLLTALSARKYGASRAGILGALFGAVAGAILGSAVVPVIGTLLGTLAGAYAGAVLMELLRSSSSQAAFRAGLGAFLGSASGKVVKMIGGIFMVVVIARSFINS